MKSANEFDFNLATGGVQHGFTISQLDDLIAFVNKNRDLDFFLLHHEIPLFDSTVIINIFHPRIPDTLCFYLFKDEQGDWWPYAVFDCLPSTKSLLKSILVN